MDHDSVISPIGRKYLSLHLTPEVGPIRCRRLVEYFGSVVGVLNAGANLLQKVDGIGPAIARSIVRAARDERVSEEIDLARTLGVRMVCAEDAEYPAPLRHIPDPPLCLYVKGQWQESDAVALAVVGTRRCSHYGREQACRFGELLGQAGFTVVSGLARGIDGEAHRGALRAGGRTVAVLGNGLSSIYPQEHEGLAGEIAARGALFSEYTLTAQPEAGNFPRRNRIIAGLCLGVLVVEAGKASGALITARLASEYNREVFAVPGRVDDPAHSAGVHSLIRDGAAKLVTCLQDILDELHEVGEILGAPPESSLAPSGSADQGRTEGFDAEGEREGARALALSVDERAVFRALADGAEETDTVCALARLPMPRVAAALTALQLKGLARRLPGERFARAGPGTPSTLPSAPSR